MIRRLATALILLVVPASFVAAQDTPTSGGGFCATAPHELLPALDGSWSLTQGPGIAIGGPPIPLPGHPPVAMRLEYNVEGGYAILRGQGQQMVMLPTSTETASNLLGGLNEHLVTSTEGMNACDWYALPTLVGTNAYDLSGSFRPPTTDPWIGPEGDWGGVDFCIGDQRHSFEWSIDGGVEVSPGGASGGNPCRDRTWVDGDMTMTIALKFDSPSSARGMLNFIGEHDGYHFAAWAPITMTR